MPDVLDRDDAAQAEDDSQMPSATVALHHRDGMVRQGHRAGVETSVGTRSLTLGAHLALWARVSVVEVMGAASECLVSEELELPADFGLVSMFEDLRGASDDVARRSMLDESPSGIADLRESLSAANSGSASDTDAMAELAWKLIDEAGPAVAVDTPTVPALADEPVENIRRLFNLTWAEFADLFGIAERNAYRWPRGVPEARRREVEALQAVGLTVIGGLGPDGAKEWLNAGNPSPADLLKAGRLAELAEAANRHLDSPFT